MNKLRCSTPSRSRVPSAGGGPSGSDTVFDYIVRQIEKQGYAIVDRPMPDGLLGQLFRNVAGLDGEAFKEAGVGRQHDFQRNSFLRRDQICWLDPEDVQVAGYFAWIEQLRLWVNRYLFLGLFDYECHYAYYPEGGFYRKHVDAFQGQSNRRLSTILYLNPQWQPSDGGELAIYGKPDDESPFVTVAPRYGRMVIFLSEVFPHEVQRANRGRFSLTGWYRINATTTGVIDPPR